MPATRIFWGSFFTRFTAATKSATLVRAPLSTGWHSASGAYWNESAYYEFSAKEVDTIEAATNNLHDRCLEAVQQVIDDKLKWGHAVWWADLDGDGGDELVIGVRDDLSQKAGERKFTVG